MAYGSGWGVSFLSFPLDLDQRVRQHGAAQ